MNVKQYCKNENILFETFAIVHKMSDPIFSSLKYYNYTIITPVTLVTFKWEKNYSNRINATNLI